MNTADYLLQNSFSSHEMTLEIKHLGHHIPENFEIISRKKLKTETSKNTAC